MSLALTSDRPTHPGRADRCLERATTEFECLRPRLLGIARRVLGGQAEAEDIVQDAWMRWQTCDRTVVVNPTAFLVTTTTRLAINATQTARARRECHLRRPVEPIDGRDGPAMDAERRADLELGLRLLLERLAPTERAAFILRHAFGYPYDRIAGLLRTTDTNARQLVSRAGRRVATDGRGSASDAELATLLPAFVSAARHGDVTGLEDLFAMARR